MALANLLVCIERPLSLRWSWMKWPISPMVMGRISGGKGIDSEIKREKGVSYIDNFADISWLFGCSQFE